MKSDIRCSACPLMKIAGRAKYNGNNDHMDRPRGRCFCKHPDAEAAFKLVCPQSPRNATFIAFTRGATDGPDIKTVPKWCPRKLAERPVEISKKQAYQVIDSRRPHGLFFLKDGEVYVGIDNRTGDAWTEEFATKSDCLKWLKNWEHDEEGDVADESV